MTRSDFPHVVAWHREPHTAPWFSREPTTLDDPKLQEFEDCIDGIDPTRLHIVEIDRIAVGYLQHYLVRDNPEYLEAVGNADAAAIDFIIGNPAYVDRGLGPKVIRSYVDAVVRGAYPSVRRVISTPDEENERSIRALEKAGFKRGPLVDVVGRPEMICTLELPT